MDLKGFSSPERSKTSPPDSKNRHHVIPGEPPLVPEPGLGFKANVLPSFWPVITPGRHWSE